MRTLADLFTFINRTHLAPGTVIPPQLIALTHEVKRCGKPLERGFGRLFPR